MKKRGKGNVPDDFTPSPPFDTISGATGGDKGAIAEVLEAYEPYIAARSTAKRTNDNDEIVEMIDEDMAQSLRLALIEEIPDLIVDV